MHFYNKRKQPFSAVRTSTFCLHGLLDFSPAAKCSIGVIKSAANWGGPLNKKNSCFSAEGNPIFKKLLSFPDIVFFLLCRVQSVQAAKQCCSGGTIYVT
jgi:hypothetical protein